MLLGATVEIVEIEPDVIVVVGELNDAIEVALVGNELVKLGEAVVVVSSLVDRGVGTTIMIVPEAVPLGTIVNVVETLPDVVVVVIKPGDPDVVESGVVKRVGTTTMMVPLIVPEGTMVKVVAILPEVVVVVMKPDIKDDEAAAVVMAGVDVAVGTTTMIVPLVVPEGGIVIVVAILPEVVVVVIKPPIKDDEAADVIPVAELVAVVEAATVGITIITVPEIVPEGAIVRVV